MADPARSRATYDDLRAVPEPFVAEIIHGQLVTSPRPALTHARAASVLGIKLGGPFDIGPGGPGGWLILDEPELHLGGHVLVPDLAGWRRERMPAMPDEPATDIVPNWVCEVLSRSTAATDRTDKVPIYAGLGVDHVWLIDPVAQTLEVLHLEGTHYSIVGSWRGGAVVRAEPFHAIEIDLAALWAR